ncbi:hypothetical protein ACFSTI_02680 [Rhizorhabdus histidinilytica]
MARFLTGTTPPPIRVAHLGCDPLPEGGDGPLPLPSPISSC